MRLKTRKLIADTVNGIFGAFLILQFMSLMLLIMASPVIVTHYTGSSWWMLLLLVVIPIVVGIISAVARDIVEGG